MGTDKNYAAVSRFDTDTESIEVVDEVRYWAVVDDEESGQQAGIVFVLEDTADGDLVITDEQLAALGYVKA